MQANFGSIFLTLYRLSYINLYNLGCSCDSSKIDCRYDLVKLVVSFLYEIDDVDFGREVIQLASSMTANRMCDLETGTTLMLKSGTR